MELLTDARAPLPTPHHLITLFWTSLVQGPSQVLEVFGPALVSSGGHSKISQAGWLTRQTFIFS